jgi:YidC/Oxa1 family membrane protein insertase
LKLISPVDTSAGAVKLALACSRLILPEFGQMIRLEGLHWERGPLETDPNGSQRAVFEATVLGAGSSEVLRLTRTYRITPGRYDLEVATKVENLSAAPLKISLELTGPGGLGREAVRSDMRKAMAGFRDDEGRIDSVSIDARKLSKAKDRGDRQLKKPGMDFLWVAATNKYFSAILSPVPAGESRTCAWVSDRLAAYHDPDGLPDTGDESVTVGIETAPVVLEPAGEQGDSADYDFRLYLGPKDKSLFDRDPYYRSMGFFHTISFMPCFCCPAAIINPLAFGILSAMKWMYGFLPNYGVVIIILVFIVRIIMHPVTKKSQVSMNKFSKIAPRAEEIRRKYASNKTEMNRQLMALYREQGASPVMGFLPMMLQMPIWIALYSAIYASIELRQARFLPFWITDLSAPDALVTFSTITIPLLGWKIESFNLLPVLMGVAMYLQQKMMPKTAAASPQAAQQQKMMMIMMPFMFPLLLYKAPSGLNLYIMASTFAGVIEQHVIRKHIAEREQAESEGLVATTSKAGGRTRKKKPKPFFRTMK